jgi:ribosomal protein S18 acetylase RimI-like enzyme
MQLMKTGFEECRRRRIEKVKVLVASENQAANKLYEKCGFELITQMNK